MNVTGENRLAIAAHYEMGASHFCMKQTGFLCALLWLVLAGSSVFGFSTVVIDAGHGGSDRGGSPGQRIAEKPYTLDIARRLASALHSRGIRTVMTRSGDYFVGLDQRCAIANAQSNAIFVSIHLNSAPRSDANGIETYFYTGHSAPLASALHSAVVRAAGTQNRGVRRRAFFVVRHTRIPAVLCECGFLTNPAEAARIQSGWHRQRIANAIASAIAAHR